MPIVLMCELILFFQTRCLSAVASLCCELFPSWGAFVIDTTARNSSLNQLTLGRTIQCDGEQLRVRFEKVIESIFGVFEFH